MTTPYRIMMPGHLRSAVVFASPHSGREYPPRFLEQSVLDEKSIRSSEDAYVDLLLETAPEHGAPLLIAQTPRAFVDLNRAADELDPAVIEGCASATTSPRVASGLGVIPRVVSNGRAIYCGKISQTEAQERLTQVWYPYHRALEDLLNATRARCDEAILIDVHSMPHEAIMAPRARRPHRPHIVLGDRFGTSCAPWVIDSVQNIFEAEGFRVARNAPFPGAYIAQKYGKPRSGQHVLQIEIDRALYLDEIQIAPSGNFTKMRKIMQRVVAQISNFNGLRKIPFAAE